MRHWTTSRKLWATLALMWIGMLLLVGWTAYDKRAGLLQERITSLEYFVGSARDLVVHFAERAERGELSVEEAQSRAIDSLDSLSFGEDGYIFAFDSDIGIVAHPRRELGDSMADFRDKNGLYLYQELKATADSNPREGGFVNYMSERGQAGGGQVPKLSYVQRVPGWEWNLAAGVYMDDINAAFWDSLIELGLLLLLIGSILTVAMGWIIKDVLKSLGGDPRHAQEVVQRIAGGDLTQSLALKDGDESSLLARIEGMRKRLASSLENIHRGTDSINTGVDQIATGNHDLSARTEQQAASIEETASSMEELTQTVRQNAENAQLANKLALDASGTARQGGDMMADVVTTMRGIAESSSRVKDIIEVIDSIAFQTNILALNASVEAARAGEQGRGFAVVAGEVRNLASRSADASREIRTLIEASNQKVNDGAGLIERTGGTIREVVEAVARMTDLMEEISSASREQSIGIEQVNTAVGQMDHVTQQNAALVEEAAGAAATLRIQAEKLVQEVMWFRINESHQHEAYLPSHKAERNAGGSLPALVRTIVEPA
ncbi:methyl-accepting chemotaxis protein [Billgrantia saliphila]|uniref:methyl-accepting chemotaxis protein n=1 Tax=Billgrantia saliphila TaxID=1848458 RepID=UPI000CE541FF|nr:methyl-accepting chemotaxis protein [Halomonas saliphila]